MASRRLGMSQVLPPDMLSRVLAEEDGKIRRILSLCRTQFTETHSDIICAMCKIILRFCVRNHGPWHAHKRVRELYSLFQVAERAEKAYDCAMKTEHPAL